MAAKTQISEAHAVLASRILNRHGLHPRLACEFVRCSKRFQSTLHLISGGREFSARRVTDLLEANLTEGAEFTIVADGPDASLAVTALDTFVRHLVVVEDQCQEAHQRRALRREDPMCD